MPLGNFRSNIEKSVKKKLLLIVSKTKDDVELSPFNEIYFIYVNRSPLTMMKKAFNFRLFSFSRYLNFYSDFLVM